MGYDLLIRLNSFVNNILEGLGRDKISISKKIKNSVKSAVKYINDFEGICADLAVANGYHQVLCGHIHAPEIRTIVTNSGQVDYLNSGDWVENCTALEYNEGGWSLFSFFEHFDRNVLRSMKEEELLDHKELFMQLLMEFNMTEVA